MPDPAESSYPAGGPDIGLVGDAPNRLPDRGPRYKETPADPYAPDAPTIAEPYNTATAFLFVVVAVVWAWRVRGRWRRFPFLLSCLPILFVGGVGGTLYHATRTQSLYFFLDVIPISVLGIAGSAYLAVRLWRAAGYVYLVAAIIGYIALSWAFWALLAPLPAFKRFHMLGVNVTYAALAVVLLIPLGVTLWQTRGRHRNWALAALASFGVAWFVRLLDGQPEIALSMGTHWLWHLFGALTTWFVVEYFYRVEGERPA
jgi:hypothetical protein